MKILITGVNGFVGSSLLDELIEDHFVIGVGRKEKNEKVSKYVQWDIGTWDDSIARRIGKCDAIIHAAASLSIKDDDDDLLRANCVGTYHIYKLARALSPAPKCVFYISSAPIIGLPVRHPIDESHPMNPQLMYHATKLSGEYILNQLNRCGTEVVNLRIQAPIGRNMPVKSIVPIFIHNAIKGENLVLNGKGTRKQTYLDFRDLGQVIKDNLTKEDIAGTYVIAGPKPVSNIDLARLCIEKAKTRSEIEFSGKPDAADNVVWDFDCSKAREKLGFVPQYSIEDSVEWMMKK